MHLVLSMCLTMLAAIIVFRVWFPYPYRELSGGRELFILIMIVDMAVGPLITLVVFNPLKSKREMLLDFSMVAVLQIAALVYGMWTVCGARPVHLVFEYDRFRVIHAVDVPSHDLVKALPEIDAMPLTGPTLLSLRALSGDEHLNFTMAAMSGVPVSARPELWRSYDQGKAEIVKVARPVAELLDRFATRSWEIAQVVNATGKTAEELLYLPVISRDRYFWTVLLDKRRLTPVGWLPIDPY